MVELLVVIVVGSGLIVFLLPAFAHHHCKCIKTNCISNLRQIGTGFQLWADDNGGFFPMHFVGNPNYSQLQPAASASGQPLDYLDANKYFLAMSNELSAPKLVVCPADSRIPGTNFAMLQNSNVSYFVGLDTDLQHPKMFLTGDRNWEVNGKPATTGRLRVNTNSTLAWTKQIHNRSGDVTQADGTTQKFSSSGMQEYFRTIYTNAARLVFP